MNLLKALQNTPKAWRFLGYHLWSKLNELITQAIYNYLSFLSNEKAANQRLPLVA